MPEARAGYEDVVLLERATDLGGTWRDNAYPGAACDVPSHLYSFSFAPNPDWSRSFSPQPEIWAYLRRVADQEGVTAKIRFGAELISARWHEVARVWRLETTDGTLTARFLVSAAARSPTRSSRTCRGSAPSKVRSSTRLPGITAAT